MQNDNNEKMPLVIATTDVDYDDPIDSTLQAAEMMFDTLPESPTRSQLSMRLAHLMLLNDLYAMRGDQKAALLCLKKAEPIFFQFIEWNKHVLVTSSVSFFLECYIRTGSCDEALRVIDQIMVILRRKCHFSQFEAMRGERLWIQKIEKARATREDRHSMLIENICSELENPPVEQRGLYNAIEGYFELIKHLRNSA